MDLHHVMMQEAGDLKILLQDLLTGQRLQKKTGIGSSSLLTFTFFYRRALRLSLVDSYHRKYSTLPPINQIITDFKIFLNCCIRGWPLLLLQDDATVETEHLISGFFLLWFD